MVFVFVAPRLGEGGGEWRDGQTSLRGELATQSRDLGTGLKRLTEIVVKTIDTTSDRFDDLELRVMRLEKKAG